MLCALPHMIFSQSKPQKYTFRKLTTEPAIGTRIQSALGAPDIQLTNLLQYNLTRKVSFVSHTAFSQDLERSNFPNVENNYSFSVMQKFGIGTTFYSRRSSSSFFLLSGIKYYAYSGTLTNPNLEESITTKTHGMTTDNGIMYNYKRGLKKIFFSARIYVPLYDGLDGITENATLEVGVGIRLK